MQKETSLIAEMEAALQSGSKDKRVDTLRRLTDLFVADSDRFSNQQIDVFDDILGHLIKRIEGKALAELSGRLAPIDNAPADVVRQLARNDDIAVAEPILTKSHRLSDADLIDIANIKSAAHLLAISARPTVSSSVTDALLQRGDRPVFHKLAENTGARFTEGGFAKLVQHSARDNQLAEKVGLRMDVPLKLFRELLLRASEAVRSRLLALAGPETREHIQRILTNIVQDAGDEATLQSKQDYAEAHQQVLAMKTAGSLNEATVLEFAKQGRITYVVAAISVLCSSPLPMIEQLLFSERREAILVACKAASLDWLIVRVLLTSRSTGHEWSDQDLESARSDYHKLSAGGAARVLRFWQIRQSTSKDIDVNSSSVHRPIRAAQVR